MLYSGLPAWLYYWRICVPKTSAWCIISSVVRLVVFKLNLFNLSVKFSLDNIIFQNRSKLQRNENRDISEVIALGVPNPRTSNEVQYDQRLFNQSKVQRFYKHFVLCIVMNTYIGRWGRREDRKMTCLRFGSAQNIPA